MSIVLVVMSSLLVPWISTYSRPESRSVGGVVPILEQPVGFVVFAAGFIVVWAVSLVGRVLIWKSFMLSASRLGVVWFSRAAWLRLAAAILPLELLGATVSPSYSWLFSYSFQLLSLVGTLFSILAFGALRRMKEDLIPLIPSAPS